MARSPSASSSPGISNCTPPCAVARHAAPPRRLRLGGIRIANVLHDRVPFTPWRFDTMSYLAAGEVGRPLTGAPVEACWDPALTSAMSHASRRIEEELVLDDLLDDLSA
jgi:hypothetical protein